MSVLLDALKKAALEKKSRDADRYNLADSANSSIESLTDSSQAVEEEQEESLEHDESDLKDNEELSIDVELDEYIESQKTIAKSEDGHFTGDEVEVPTLQDQTEDKSTLPEAPLTLMEPVVEPVAVEGYSSNDDVDVAALDQVALSDKEDKDEKEKIQRLALAALLEKNRKSERLKKIKLVSVFLGLIVVILSVLTDYYLKVENAQYNDSIRLVEQLKKAAVADEVIVDERVVNEGLDKQESIIKEEKVLVKNLPHVNASRMDVTEPKVKKVEKTDERVKKKTIKFKIPAEKRVESASESSQISIRLSAPSKLDNVIAKAYSAYNLGDASRAKALYSEALNIDSKNKDALLGYAAVAALQRQYGEALDYYYKVLELSPQDVHALGGILAVLSRDTLNPEVFSNINTLVDDFPDNASLHFLKGSILASKSNWVAAQQSFFEALSRDPNRADYALNLAISLDYMGKTKESLKFYHQVITNAKNSILPLDIKAIKKRIMQLESVSE